MVFYPSNRYLRGVSLCAGVLSLLTMSACTHRKQAAPIVAEAPVAVETEYFNAKITAEGQTLGQVAAWYTGNAANWNLLVEHNPGLSPEKMRVGDLIRIPRDLLKREDKLPEKKPAPAPERAVASATDSVVMQGGGDDFVELQRVSQKTEPTPSSRRGKPEATREIGENPYRVEKQPLYDQPLDEERSRVRDKTRYEVLQEILDSGR
jgi:hypothetical protein